MAQEPKVILLGGAPGTGKTTLGNLLVRKLGLDHHLSTGFIRASVRPLLPEPEQRLLGMHAFDVGEALPERSLNGTSRVFQGVLHQATMLKPSIESCVRRAVREGMGLVIEGSHMIPGVLDPTELGATLLCVLDVTDRETLRSRALSTAHVHRKLDEEQLTRLFQLQEDLVDRAHALGVPVIMNDRLPDALEELIGLATKPERLAS